MRSRSTSASTVGSWLGRLFRLDFSVLAEVRANPSATSAAIVVVLVASLFAGLGSWLWALQSFVDDRDAFIRAFIVGSLLQTVVWFSWVYVAYLVLTQGYGARQDFGEMTRAMGFAFAPVALSVFIFVGALAVPIGLIDRKSTRLNSSHITISYAVFCLKKKKKITKSYDARVYK